MHVTNPSPSTSRQPMPLDSADNNRTLGRIYSIQSLPPEILQNIAFSLPFKSYNNLRRTNSYLSTSLISIRDIVNEVCYCHSGSKGQIKIHKDDLLYNAIIRRISLETAFAIANRRVYFLGKDRTTWAINCRYRGNFSDAIPVKDILSAISPDAGHHHAMLDGTICSTLHFDLMNEEYIETLFNKADDLFLAKKEDSGLLMASIMSSLYGHLSGLRSADGTLRFPPQLLTQYHNPHCLMFRVGNLMNKHTPPFIGLMPLSARDNIDRR